MFPFGALTAPLGARGAVARARAFLERWQLAPGRVPAALDPAHAAGAFPASPVASSRRCDITAHALLALADRAPSNALP